MRLGGREGIVLGTGYAVVFGLLICSTVEAFRLEQSLSEGELATYQRHIERENALAQLRDLVWLGASQAREYLIRGNSPRFLNEVKALRREGAKALGSTTSSVAQNFRAFTEALQELGAADAQASLQRLERDLAPARIRVIEALNQELVRSQRDLHAAESGFTQNQRATIEKLFLLLGACLLFGFVTVRIVFRQLVSWHKERTEHFSEVARLSARLLDVQEEERRSLSRELHDQVGQMLTALRMELALAPARISDPHVRERVQRAQGIAERTLQIVRNIALMLRPALLDDLGLAPALEWHLRQFGRRSGIKVDFATFGDTAGLPDETKTCIYRVSQEALNNCEKYSGATGVAVSLTRVDERLSLEIRDNGSGFDMQSRPPLGGAGLVGIRERVARLGGGILIESGPGAGTRLLVTLPLAHSRSERAPETVSA